MEQFRLDHSLSTDEKFKHLEENDIRLYKEVSGIQVDLKERYARIDESNKYLREQNMQILTAVLEGNTKSQERADERLKAQEDNKAKFWMTAIGSGGVIGMIIQVLTNLI